MKFPNGIDYRPKFRSVHEGLTSSYTPCLYDRHGYSTEKKIFNFYGYRSWTNRFPNKCIITNLTNPNREDVFDEPMKTKYKVIARHGDVLTIETERERHVVCASGNSIYSLLSSTAEMSWPEEVKEALAAISVEKNNWELVKSLLGKFFKNNNHLLGHDINSMTDKVYDEIIKHNGTFDEEGIAMIIWNILFNTFNNK